VLILNNPRATVSRDPIMDAATHSAAVHSSATVGSPRALSGAARARNGTVPSARGLRSSISHLNLSRFVTETAAISAHVSLKCGRMCTAVPRPYRGFYSSTAQLNLSRLFSLEPTESTERIPHTCSLQAEKLTSVIAPTIHGNGVEHAGRRDEAL
jgi:hypothetical protein